METETTNKTIQIQMSLLDQFNQVIDFVNSFKDHEIPRNMKVIDVKLGMVMQRMRAIAEIRLKETKDESDPILQELLSLGIVQAQDVPDQIPAQANA